MTVRTGVGWHIKAAHADRYTGEVHGHSYEVIAWHECENQTDAEALQIHLKELCGAFSKMLPDDLAWAEDLAAAILKLSPPSCVEVEISRPSERLHAKVSR